jgi:hypothetical protein
MKKEALPAPAQDDLALPRLLGGKDDWFVMFLGHVLGSRSESQVFC